MNNKKIYDYLTSAEGGNVTAQNELCQVFFSNNDVCKAMPDDFWEKVDRIAQDGHDYANFIMHCRYFDDLSQSSKSYDYVRKAIRHKDIPLAFLRLGLSYTKGIGTKENHVLANFFYDMSLAMGCQEATCFIDQEYDLGRRTIVNDVERALNNTDHPNSNQKALVIKRVERERIKKNYGYLSELREYIPLLYPDFNPQKGIDDILNNRDTIDADVIYSLSTSRNHLEICIESLDNLLEQLYAPIIQDKELLQSIIKHDDTDLLDDNERALLQCVDNITTSYDKICETYGVKKKEMLHINSMELFPYLKVSMITMLRRQALSCLFSIKDIDPVIEDKYLKCLDNEEQMLNLCEDIEDEDIQLFLISFVELNIDVETIMLNYHSLLNLYRDHNLDALARYLNTFISRLTDAGIEHGLPEFTSDNLPPIELAV